MYRKTRLDNGLRIITHSMPARQSVALGIWIKVGARYEPSKYKGISHYMEHLAFKGTKKHSCRQIKESIEGVGGSLNGFTSEELTCYLVKLPSRYLDLALDILSRSDVINLICSSAIGFTTSYFLLLNSPQYSRAFVINVDPGYLLHGFNNSSSCGASIQNLQNRQHSTSFISFSILCFGVNTFFFFFSSFLMAI